MDCGGKLALDDMGLAEEFSVSVGVRDAEEEGPGPRPDFDACVRGLLDALSAAVRVRVQSVRRPPLPSPHLQSPAPAAPVPPAEAAGTGAAAPDAGGGDCDQGEWARGLDPAAVLVLFSGGLDSAVVARLAHDHCPAGEPIDLASVCFASGQSADRLAARSAVEELRRAAPGREWRLIEARVHAGRGAHAIHVFSLLAVLLCSRICCICFRLNGAGRA